MISLLQLVSYFTKDPKSNAIRNENVRKLMAKESNNRKNTHIPEKVKRYTVQNNLEEKARELDEQFNLFKKYYFFNLMQNNKTINDIEQYDDDLLGQIYEKYNDFLGKVCGIYSVRTIDELLNYNFQLY